MWFGRFTTLDLPVNTVKTDQSFIRDLRTENSSLPLVKATVAAARSLRMCIVAEGIETEAQLRTARSLGCDVFQDDYISPPLPAACLHEFLAPAAA